MGWQRAATETCAALSLPDSSGLKDMQLTFVVSPRCAPFDERVGVVVDLRKDSTTYHVSAAEREGEIS